MLRKIASKLLKFNKAPSKQDGAVIDDINTPPPHLCDNKLRPSDTNTACDALPPITKTTQRVLKIREEQDLAHNNPYPDRHGFNVADIKLKSMDTLIIRDSVNPQKKPWWLVFLTDIFNGLVTTILILLTFGLLAESYCQPAYPYMAWFAFIPFTIAVFNIRHAMLSFLFGAAVGTLFYMSALYWIYPTVQVGTNNLPLAMSAVIGLSALLSLQFALFGLACHYLKRIKWLFPVSAACAWVMFEFAHQFIAYISLGFPWFVLGYTQVDNLPLIQISTITGAYGISFLIAFFGLSLGAAACIKNRIIRIAYFILPLVALIATYVFGIQSIKEQRGFAANNPQTLAVALVQPNTHTRMLKGEEEDAAFIIAEQVEPLRTKPLNLIIWPESSLAGSFADTEYSEFLKTLSADSGAMQITGSYFKKNGKDYVSAATFNKDGIVDVYNKVKLVPFGEFLPLHKLLKKLYAANNIATFTGNFITGKEPGKTLKFTLPKEQGLAGQQSFDIGANICFESIFPAIWHKQAANGAQFFVNITNDGWFLDTAAPHQHLRINIMRAAETRRPVLRVANTGISAWIDSVGEVRFKTKTHTQETALFDFYFNPRASKTFYTLNGDVFAYLCILLTVTVLIFSISFRGIKNGGD